MSSNLPVRDKVFAYITMGDELLVFRQPYAPQAGLQVPAGTLEPGEAPEAAVVREAMEESGLAGLSAPELLGEHERNMSDFGRAEVNRRRFYHLRYAGPRLVRWRHVEERPSGGGGPYIFEFFWAPLAELPALIADHDRFVPELRARLDRV